MDQPPYHLDRVRGDAVLEAMRQVCAYRGWKLLAAHVRTTHVHAVVETEAPPERVMTEFKAYASRRLNQMGLDELGRKHGRDMVARDICGSRSTSRQRFNMLSPSKASRCQCWNRMRVKLSAPLRSRLRVPGRGSLGAPARSNATTI